MSSELDFGSVGSNLYGCVKPILVACIFVVVVEFLLKTNNAPI